MNNLSQFIKSQGWSMYAVIDIESLSPQLSKHKIIFEEWVSRGFSADLDYLDNMKEDRFSPENKLSDIKSIIVLMASYNDSSWVLNRGLNRGIIARYARGKDYHRVLKKKLIKLSNYLKKQNSSCHTYASVDSGPTVDRVFAEFAGLGFFGKSCNLINPSNGSYFFIASLMTNVELEPTPKKCMPNCGNCNKCQKSCPTRALISPGVIDASKCISYLTIENKGIIPIELRSKIGNRLFGCDICQEVCPFNERKQVVLIDQIKSENGVGDSLDLKNILSIKNDEEFLNKFAGTPLMRAKRFGLIRNACIVAGNIGDESDIPYLKGVLNGKNNILKEHADWGIKQIKLKNDLK